MPPGPGPASKETHMKSRLPLLVGLAFLFLALVTQAEEVQKLRYHGAEVYAMDAEIRAAFDKANPKTLAETKHKLLAVTEPAFDWTKLVKRPYSYTQRKTPYCWALAQIEIVK